MPKLRVVRKPEDSAKIPMEQAVSVEVPKDAELDLGQPEKIEVAPEKKPEPKPKVKPEPETQVEDPTLALKKQLEDLQKAKDASDARATEAERQRHEAIKRAKESQDKVTEVSGLADQAQYDAVLSAMGAAQSELESAKEALKIAAAAQDWATVADAQERLSGAKTRLTQLEDGKAAIEDRREKEKNKPKPEPIQQSNRVEDYIDSMPNLLDAERSWLKTHPELMIDDRKNTKLKALHYDALDSGANRGTPEYFQFLEVGLGYKKAPVKQPDPEIEDDIEEENDNSEQHRRAANVSAPPSRDTPSAGTGRSQNSRITLSPEQREAAKMAGISEIDYARQLMKYQEMRRDGTYRDN